MKVEAVRALYVLARLLPVLLAVLLLVVGAAVGTEAVGARGPPDFDPL